jgi:hypothetical protein
MKVIAGEPVSVKTVRLARILGSEADTTQDVQARRDRLKVGRVYTQFHAAQVINVQT